MPSSSKEFENKRQKEKKGGRKGQVDGGEKGRKKGRKRKGGWGRGIMPAEDEKDG